jgi:Zn-dependent protease
VNAELSPTGIALVIAVLVLSLGIHEAAHGWMAWKCGDPTARDLGRVTLNPFVHIDPFMTIVLPLVLFLSAGFIFGGAKPVPVAFHRLRNPMRDMALVAAAGPVANMLLAAFLFLLNKLLVTEFGIWDANTVGNLVLLHSVFLNVLLAAFNLVPIPPLDGSRIMAWLLPENLRAPYVQLERMGMILVLVAVFLIPGFRTLVLKTTYFLFDVVEQVVTLGGIW